MIRLFIGGTADGKWIDCDTPEYRFPIYKELKVTYPMEWDKVESGELNYEIYILTRVTEKLSLYILKRMSVAEVVERLVQNYRPLVPEEI